MTRFVGGHYSAKGLETLDNAAGEALGKYNLLQNKHWRF